MPKRSLSSGNGDQKKIERLNTAVELMLSRTDSQVGISSAVVGPCFSLSVSSSTGFPSQTACAV